MSYVVLARKYRPPNFGAMVGQEHVVQALSNALTQQRLHHAYLFTGTRGVGKTTISRILAKSLNCTGPDGQGGISAQSCGVCAACRDIDAGRFIDYVELDAASNRGVDEISQLLDQAVYKPVVGRFKVYMIDEVHMLSTTAFNAMLKTLEEPPEYLKFVLATTDPQKVPATVLSRCLQFNLRPMASATVEEHLADVLTREDIAAEVGALRLIARAARGSMRDALSLTDQAIAFGAGTLRETAVRQMLGAVDRGHAVRLLEAVAANDGKALVRAVDELRGLGLSAAGTLEELAATLQQMAVLQVVPDALDLSDPDAPEAARLASLIAADETQLLYSIALHGRPELAIAPDEYSGLVMVLLRMLAFRPKEAGQVGSAVPSPQGARATPAVRTPAEARGGSDSATTGSMSDKANESPAGRAVDFPGRVGPAEAGSGPVQHVSQPAVVAAAPALRVAPPMSEPPPWLDVPFEEDEVEATALPNVSAASSRPPSAPPAGAAPPAPVPEAARPSDAGTAAAPVGPASAEGDRWAAWVRMLNDTGAVSAFARELAMQAQCIGIDEQATALVVRLRVERETLRGTSPCEKLQAALAQRIGRPVRLEVEAGVAHDSPARRDAAELARRQAEAERVIHDDPLVQALMAQYKTARIVPGSVKPIESGIQGARR